MLREELNKLVAAKLFAELESQCGYVSAQGHYFGDTVIDGQANLTEIAINLIDYIDGVRSAKITNQ